MQKCVCVCVVQSQACGEVVQRQWEGSQKHPTAEERMVQSPITHTQIIAQIVSWEREQASAEMMLARMLKLMETN